jgi:hypothetical protein
MHRLYPKNPNINLKISNYPRVLPSSFISREYNYLRYDTDSKEFYTPSIVKLNNDKILVTYYEVTENKIYVSIVNDSTILLNTLNPCASNEYEFNLMTINPNSIHSLNHCSEYGKSSLTRSKLYKTPTNEILLFIYDPGSQNNIDRICKIYKSKTGLCNNIDDWELYSEVFNFHDDLESGAVAGVWYSSGILSNIGPIQTLKDNRIGFIYGYLEKYTSFDMYSYGFAYSDDNGLTWNNSRINYTPTGTYDGTPCSGTHGIGVFNNCLITSFEYGYLTCNKKFAYSLDNGENWSLCGEYQNLLGDMAVGAERSHDFSIQRSGNYNYLLKHNYSGSITFMIYKYPIDMDIDLDGQNPYNFPLSLCSTFIDTYLPEFDIDYNINNSYQLVTHIEQLNNKPIFLNHLKSTYNLQGSFIKIFN